MIERKNDYKVILFDLDGTVVDSKPGILTSIKYALDFYNVPYTDDVVNKMIGPPFKVSMRELIGIKDEDFIDQLINKYRAKYQQGEMFDSSIFEGVENLVKKLKDDGFIVCIATSKPLCFTMEILKSFDMVKYFDYIGGVPSDLSPYTKSDVINMVLQNVGNPDKSSVLMIGDRLYDIVGAKQSGVDVLAVLWGYGDREEFEKYGADYILNTPNEVYDFLTKRA